jgi:septal ring factor EnvC (AmiA/AmiB activator)
MLDKTEIGERIRENEQRELREKIEGTLCKLHELKERVAELKRKCEELRKIESERFERVAENVLQCDKCGHALDPEEQVVIKNAKGEERRHYHKECFQTLFK